MKRTTSEHYPDMDSGVLSTITDFAVDMSQRTNFFVAILTSIVSSIVIGFQNGDPLFVLVSILLFLGIT
jgi:hypothetical protein